MALSPQQQAVLDFSGDPANGSLNLVARAGCGKTYTLIALVSHLLASFDRISIYLGAYNKPIATEIQNKLKASGVEEWKKDDSGKWIAPRANAGTMHSAGYRAWKKYAESKGWKLGETDDKKLDKILDKLAEAMPERSEDILTLRGFAVKAVSLAKQRAFGVLCSITDQSKWYDLVDHFSLEEELPEDYDTEKAIKLAIWLYRRSLEACCESIDFDDQILAPLYFNVRMWQYDWVLIDESQDTNPARRALAKKMLKPGTGRLVAVGDPHQAIYGFTGADSDSMDIIKAEFRSAELPLNVTFRCWKSIVRLAQTWVPDITAHPDAPEGIVRTIDLNRKAGAPETAPTFWSETLTKDDIILCRNTKPLVEMAYALIRRGIACQVEGREIAQGLLRIINRWKCVNLTALDNAIESYRARETQKWIAKGKEDKAERVNDQCETIRILSEKLQGEGKRRVEDLVDFIGALFGSFDKDPAVKPEVLTLCTIHKSKGREWKRVYLLGRAAYMPSKWAKKEWQMEQEKNLCYVAVTRAQEELVEVRV